MNSPSQPLDAYQLVASLTDHEVDFVVIGGVALQAHGHVRTTLDIGDAETLYNGGNFLMHTRHGDLDVFAVEIRGVTLLIAHADDLIRMKTAASQFRDRPAPKRRQDLDDIAVLEQLRRGTAPTPER